MINTSFLTLEEKEVSKKWLTTKEAASYLSITPNALRIWVCRGKIMPARLGRKLRFCKAKLDDFLLQKRRK